MKIIKKDKRSDLRKEYDRAVETLRTLTKGSDEYGKQLEIVERLTELLKAEEAGKFKIDPNAVLGFAGNLLGIGMILGYEQMHVISTKALQFVFKGRLR